MFATEPSEGESLFSRIKEFEESVEINYKDIQNYRKVLLDGDSNSKSISSEIESTFEDIE